MKYTVELSRREYESLEINDATSPGDAIVKAVYELGPDWGPGNTISVVDADGKEVPLVGLCEACRFTMVVSGDVHEADQDGVIVCESCMRKGYRAK